MTATCSPVPSDRSAGLSTAAVGLLLAGVLSGCSGDGGRSQAAGSADPSVAATTPVPTGTSPVPTATVPRPTGTGDPAAAPPFRADTRPDTATASGGRLSVVAVRAARQAGYDRVVLELRGRTTGTPGWDVRYVTTPSNQGSGARVPVQGSAYLQVVVTGVGYPFDTGQTEASGGLRPTRTEVVRDVRLQGTFEGRFQAFVGLAARRPFRVFRLADPARVVIDVRHA